MGPFHSVLSGITTPGPIGFQYGPLPVQNARHDVADRAVSTDRRLEPWLDVMQAGLDPTDEARFEQGEDRWIAVCTGLALHPDFLTY